MQLVRLAVFNFQTDNQAWPPEAGVGAVPVGLEPYLPEGFDLVQEGYMLDFDNWGGSPFTVGITLVTSDSILGRTTLGMMPAPKWNSGNKYTWIFE